MSASTFVLIPGAWHSSTCWQRVVPLLQAHGHRVITLDLLGTGSDHTPLSQVKLVMWVNQVVDLVQEQETPVILVGHSRGGLIISEVAQRVPEKIKLLVYLTAFLIPSGKTLNSTITKANTEDFFTLHLDGTLTLKPDKMVPVLYNTTSPEWIERIPSMLSPEPATTFATPLELTDDRFGCVPRAYIECTQDKALLPELQRCMYNQLPCKYVITMSTDHSPFFSAPSELATHLIDLAAKA
jgi:pimeloyl-ACP methyl ester carboxylesterase